jgi:hypothetical protein
MKPKPWPAENAPRSRKSPTPATPVQSPFALLRGLKQSRLVGIVTIAAGRRAPHNLPPIIHFRTVSLLASIPCFAQVLRRQCRPEPFVHLRRQDLHRLLFEALFDSPVRRLPA